MASLQEVVAQQQQQQQQLEASTGQAHSSHEAAPQPQPQIGKKRSRWDATPAPSLAAGIAGRDPSSGHSVATASGGGPLAPGAPTPAFGSTSIGAATPAAGVGLAAAATPLASQLAGLGVQTPVGAATGSGPGTYGSGSGAGAEGAAGGQTLTKFERELLERNRPLTDEELDAMLPSEGYAVLEEPQDYKPLVTPTRKLLATPTPAATPGFTI